RADRDGLVVPAHGAPALAGQAHVTDLTVATHRVEGDDLLPHQAAVHAGRADSTSTLGNRCADGGSQQDDAEDGDDDGGDDLKSDGIRRHGGDEGGREASDRSEEGVEGEVVDLHADQHDADGDPGDGQHDTSFPRECTAGDPLRVDARPRKPAAPCQPERMNRVVRRWRWAVVVALVALLAAIPAVVGALPVRATSVAPAQLAAAIVASASKPYQGYIETRGQLGLPDLPDVDTATSLLGGPAKIRAW